MRARAKKLYDKEGRAWAASGRSDAAIEVPLHPPTEREALAELDRMRVWVESWRAADEDSDVEVTWAVRNWSRVGSQTVPVRAAVRGPDAIARIAGEASAWSVLTERLSALRALVGPHNDAVLRSHARLIGGLEPDDFARLVDVLNWLDANPASGRLVRELPIRGIDTKWIEVRRGLVEALHRAGTGATTLGLKESAPLVRMRVLDSAFTFRGLTDVSAPVVDLAASAIQPDRVFVFENLATVLAMPDVPGAVAVHGGGHRVDLVAQLPWAQIVTYWGDLDSHGFAILNRLRARGVEATAALMDSETLLDHRDLWGQDPEPNTGVFSLLTGEERDTLQLLSAQSNARLEQERIPWDYALHRLGLR